MLFHVFFDTPLRLTLDLGFLHLLWKNRLGVLATNNCITNLRFSTPHLIIRLLPK